MRLQLVSVRQIMAAVQQWAETGHFDEEEDSEDV